MDDDRLVEIARSRGWLGDADLDRLRTERARLADRGVDRSLWFLAQDLGLLDDQRARELRRSISSAHVRALTVEGWTLTGRVGSGGMGDVFRAIAADGAVAAVKLLSSRFATDTEHVRRFAREARASLRLRHPHIVASLGAGAADGTRYLIMELVSGPALKARLADGPLSVSEAVCLLLQVAAGLEHAWSHGVLHRDVKPANILLAPPRPGVSEPFCAKICDFGLAKVHAGADSGADDTPGGLTGTGLALGTPHYMSPEQASGDQDLDCRSDMYGLGASLYHALIGQTLFSGKSSAAIMYQQVTSPVGLAALQTAGLPAALIAVIARLLAKSRQERFLDWAQVIVAASAIDPGLAGAQNAAAELYQVPPLSPKAHGAHSDILPAVIKAPPARPVPEPGRASAPVRRQPWLLLTMAGAALCVPLLALLALRPPGAISATPATVASILGAADGAAPRTVHLAPGLYPGLRLGRVHAGWTVSGPAGARITGEPAVRLDPGAVGITMDGFQVVGRGPGPAILVAPGAGLILTGLRIEGSGDGIQLDGRLIAASSAVAVQGCGLVAGIEAEADLDQVMITGLHGLIAATHARIRWRASGGESTAHAISATGTSLELRGLRLVSAAAALHLDGGDLRLDQVILAGAVGLEGGRTRIEGDGVVIEALQPLRWLGSPPPGSGAWTFVRRTP